MSIKPVELKKDGDEIFAQESYQGTSSMAKVCIGTGHSDNPVYATVREAKVFANGILRICNQIEQEDSPEKRRLG